MTRKVTLGPERDHPWPLNFVASTPQMLGGVRNVNDLLIAVNEIRSPRQRAAFEQLLATGKRVLLDSGIYALTNEHARAHRVSMNDALTLAPDTIDGFDSLWNLYGSVLREYGRDVWGVIELDQGGAKHKRVTRQRIEDEFGVVPMPVYHPLLDGWDYLDELAEGYDRFCFGNIVQADAYSRVRLLMTLFERQRASFPDVWVHVLGFNLNETWLGVPWYGSSDSSSWTRTMRWAKSSRSFSLGRRIGRMHAGIWYRYGSNHRDDDGYWRSAATCSAQDGVFLPASVRDFRARTAP